MRADNVGIAGAFEELPAILVVLVAVSLFSVSVAHVATSNDQSDEYSVLQEDCLVFTAMVRASKTLCEEGQSGTYSLDNLQNITEEDFLKEFNATALEIGYKVTVQCLDSETGNITLNWTARTGELPQGGNLASFNSCVSVDNRGIRGAARLTVTIWRDVP